MQRAAVETGQAELVLRAADPILNGQLLHRLEPGADTVDARRPLTQPRHHLEQALVALIVRRQVDQDAPAVDRHVDAVHTDK